MSWKGLSKRDVDRLLRRAFRDDMPTEIEEQMHWRLRELWQRASEAAPTPAHAAGPVSGATPGWFPLVLNLRRALLAACAVVMLVSGGALRIGHTSSFLAESFALRQTASSVIGRLERARQMECRLQARDDEGRVVRYSISWVEGRNSRVEMEGPAGKEVRFAPAQRMRTSVVNVPWPAGRTVGSRPQERWLEPIRDFLSAPAVAGLMAGQWRVAPVPGSGEKDRTAFLMTAPASPNLILVVVDLHTYLPVSLALFPAGSGSQLLNSGPLFSAEFQWDSPSTPLRQP
jgi:hypothetical protein